MPLVLCFFILKKGGYVILILFGCFMQMTPKEAFRMLSHKFHGKGPGKMKQEKRMKQYQEDLKTKQMKASDTPLLAMEKMREAQSRLKTPYLVLSGHVKPGYSHQSLSSAFIPFLFLLYFIYYLEC